MDNSYDYLLAFPLVAAISLVYAASRHEDWKLIWRHAIRLSGMILGILIATMVVLLVVNTRL